MKYTAWEIVGLFAFALVVFNVVGLSFGLFGDWFRFIGIITMMAVMVGYRAAWLSGRDGK